MRRHEHSTIQTSTKHVSYHSLCFLVPSSLMAKSTESGERKRKVISNEIKTETASLLTGGNKIKKTDTWCFDVTQLTLSCEVNIQSQQCVCHNTPFCCIMGSKLHLKHVSSFHSALGPDSSLNFHIPCSPLYGLNGSG